MMTFTKESISEAINIIEQHPEIRKGRESQEYDLIFGGKKYPPILVLPEPERLNIARKSRNSSQQKILIPN